MGGADPLAVPLDPFRVERYALYATGLTALGAHPYVRRCVELIVRRYVERIELQEERVEAVNDEIRVAPWLRL